MAQVALTAIQERVIALAKNSTIESALGRVKLEADRDEEGSDFLRIIVEVKNLDKVSDRDLEAFARSIENALNDIDDRFPSIRFADAA